MRSPHLRRPGFPPPTILAVLAGLAWLAAVASRALDCFAWSWWIVLSPPLAAAALFVLYVAGALGLSGYFALVARWTERRERARRRAAQRRVKQFFDRGLHLQDHRNQPPHCW